MAVNEATAQKNAAKRTNEIWSGTNGESLCVSKACMGYNLYSEIVYAPISKAKTWNGAFRYTDAERADMKDFYLNELKRETATCECGRVKF
jgi:hypothetical protein